MVTSEFADGLLVSPVRCILRSPCHRHTIICKKATDSSFGKFHANMGATFHRLEYGQVDIETLSADCLLPHARSAIFVHLA